MIALVEADPSTSPEAETETETTASPKRSGGPRSQAGKEASRRNALKHGLRAEVLLPDDLAEAVAERNAELSDEIGPKTVQERWLVGEIALATARLDRCAAMSIADLGRCVDRAMLCWESDRRQAVEELGARLAKDPSRFAHALRRTRQGADWLIERWEGLGESLESNGDWNDDQRRLAFDLLGVAPALRDGSRKVPTPGDRAAMSALVAREVDRLRDDQDAVLDSLDEAERGMAASGMPFSEDAETARLRRYESACRRALHRAQAELRRLREGAESADPNAKIPGSLTNAAADFLARRTESALRASFEAIEIEPEPEPEPKPAVTPAPAPSQPSLNRRQRRAQELKERKEARRAARAVASSR